MPSAAPVLVLGSRSGAVDPSSLSVGILALAIRLTLAFLAPVAVAALLIATDGGENRGTRSDGRVAVSDERTSKRPRSGSPSTTQVEGSTDDQQNTRARAERTER